MSRDNVEMVRRAYDAWNSQEALPAFLAYLSEDFEFVNPTTQLSRARVVGIKGW